MSFHEKVKAYLLLTKPTIMLLVVITGASALVMERNILSSPLDTLLILFGLFLTGGSANALNQYFERDIDSRMSRTKARRPLPQGKISSAGALTFAISIGAIGVAIFALRYNWLSAGLALGTVLFYGLFYTLWLKPNTAQNIVIGGAAGAMAPVIGWAAAANAIPVEPWLLFLIIFLWTPPHFWALALYLKDDYKTVGLPMMPVVKGDAETLRQMWLYTIALVAISLCLGAFGAGWLYLTVAVLLGAVFIKKCWLTKKHQTRTMERGLFLYSIVYLLSLFGTIILEGLTGLNRL